MKLSTSDLQLMRGSLAAIFASGLLSSVIIFASSQYANHNQETLRTAQSQMNDARNRLTAARQDQENLSIYSTEYGLLQKQNIIGDDHRLDWIEGLEKLRDQNLTVDFRYNISPQIIYAPQPAIDSGNFDIHYSETKLQFDLLHEGQLLNYFDALRSQIKGRFQLEGCAMQRIAMSQNTGTPTSAHIKADCVGGWITLKNRNAPQ